MSEYKPTEYVVDFGDCRSSAFVELNMALIEQNGAKLGEPIVRCRDCAKVKGILPDSETGETKPCCTMFGFLVGSEGFCAWGERK